MCDQSWATFRPVAMSCIKYLTFQHRTISIFAPLKVVAFLPGFNVFWTAWEDACWLWQTNWGMRWALVRPPFLDPSPCEASSAVPKEGCLVIQGIARWCWYLGLILDDQYPEPPACMIRTVASSDIFPIATGFGSVGVDLSFWVCTMKFCFLFVFF